ncbi:MAG: hypothetical protein EHM61_29165 [Acidobacteria bacterium]|nr:MAG: hypothetical protein EHM61_29165 [Acidobacteriota bacterium]
MARLGCAGCRLRISSAAQGACFGPGGRAVAGPGRGRKYGDLQPCGCRDPETLAGKGSGLVAHREWTNSEFPEGVSNINGDFGTISGGRFKGSSVGANLYRHLAAAQTVFEPLMGIADPDSVAIAVDASPAEQVSLQYVSNNFFQGLGAWPAIGRPFQPEEDRVGQQPVAIVSHRFWKSHLGGRPEALDRSVRINNVPARIVGVAPPRFFGLQAGQWTDVYAPIAMRVAFRPGQSGGAPRGEDDRLVDSSGRSAKTRSHGSRCEGTDRRPVP